ncbi:MAG: hypothetical protein GXP39_08395 [Chloroflexi bacterium]|nr:hypothetical protein [Chloroflexota bacterium]
MPNENGHEGATRWLIPDAYLPEPIGEGPYFGHEAICVLNTGPKDAHLHLDFYFEDRPPIKDVEVTIPAERTRHLRLDQPEQIGGVEIPIGVPYAIRVRSDVPVVVQYSRLDTTQTNMALMTAIAYPLST